MLSKDEIKTEDKLLNYVLRATRRDEVSNTTLRAIRTLSEVKQLRLDYLAYKFLPQMEYHFYKIKTEGWFTRPTKVRTLNLKLGFGKEKFLHHAVLRELREEV